MRTFYLVKGKHLRQNFEDGDRSCPPADDSSMGTNVFENDEVAEMQSEQRWIEWNLEIIKPLLKQIVARRAANPNIFRKSSMEECPTIDTAAMPWYEVREVIELPGFDRRAARRQRDNEEKVELPDKVVEQLKEFISRIAAMYNLNAFHNVSSSLKFSHCVCP